jgi:nitric oxide dioxygenase
MSLSVRQIDLVQSSFARIVHVSDEAARQFCARLFEIAPELRPMFHGDMAEQGQKLVGMLAVVVNNLRDMATLLPVAGALAERHLAFGVQAEHYLPVGQALIETLADTLGDDFTAEVRTAWSDAYGALSGAMIGMAYARAA